jgi:hypothetical protein
LNTPESRILKHLIFIYGEKQAEVIYATLMRRLDEFRTRNTSASRAVGRQHSIQRE